MKRFFSYGWVPVVMGAHCFLMGCTSASQVSDGHIFADAALKHAARYDAATFAEKTYRKAETHFIRGRREYQSQMFEEADRSFQLSIKYAKLSMRKAFIEKAKASQQYGQ